VTKPPTKALLVDTDMALDDWMAIAFLRASPHVDLRAITIAATGEAHAKPGVKNALRLCALADKGPVDVAAGRATPLKGTHAFPWFIRLIMDLRFGFNFWPRATQSPSSDDAVTVLRKQLERAPAHEPVTILALGPLTNLAELFTQHPHVREKVARVVSMGGAFRVPGNLHEMIKTDNQHAEWNIFIDPHAANVVFRSGVPVWLVPLDATNQLPMTDTFYARVLNETRTPAGDVVKRVLKRIKPLMKPSTPFCFWDPLTAVIAVHDQAAQFSEHTITVEESEGAECGRLREDPNGARIRICHTIDRATFEDAFLAGLNGAAFHHS
jgi:inosine-uridine nucleoside N-ribohydrolase